MWGEWDVAGVKNAGRNTVKGKEEAESSWSGDKTHFLTFFGVSTPQGWQDVGLGPQCLGAPWEIRDPKELGTFETS